MILLFVIFSYNANMTDMNEIALALSGPEEGTDDLGSNFECTFPSLSLIYPPVEQVWRVTNYSGEEVDFEISMFFLLL